MSTASAILHQLCPRCRAGKMFRGSLLRVFPKMHERCPVCELKFEREEGYFLGAMYISYGIGVIMICLFSAGVWLLTRWSLERVVLVGVALFLPFVPLITLYSRVLWIYLDRSVDPGQEK
jgi:uncharacterized protein (DUF983 family)